MRIVLNGSSAQVLNGILWVDHLPWRHYEGGVVPAALTPDKYNECAARPPCLASARQGPVPWATWSSWSTS